MASSDSEIDKPQRGRPKRAEVPDANINTGAQNINTERTSLHFRVGRSRDPLLQIVTCQTVAQLLWFIFSFKLLLWTKR